MSKQPKQFKSFKELEEAIPLAYMASLRDAVRAERDELVDHVTRGVFYGPRPRRSAKLVAAKEEEAKGYFVADVNAWLAGELKLTPEGVLSHRPRYAQTWALAQLLRRGGTREPTAVVAVGGADQLPPTSHNAIEAQVPSDARTGPRTLAVRGVR